MQQNYYIHWILLYYIMNIIIISFKVFGTGFWIECSSHANKGDGNSHLPYANKAFYDFILFLQLFIKNYVYTFIMIINLTCERVCNEHFCRFFVNFKRPGEIS